MAKHLFPPNRTPQQRPNSGVQNSNTIQEFINALQESITQTNELTIDAADMLASFSQPPTNNNTPAP